MKNNPIPLKQNSQLESINLEPVNKTNRNRTFYQILFITIAVFILAFDYAFVFIPKKAQSETENRTLQQFPKLNFTTLINGKFESSFDSYIADQFPGRDLWVEFKSYTDMISGKTESNGIYLGKDGFLIKNYNLPLEEIYQKKISEIKNLKEANPQLNFNALIAPTALSIYNEKLPENAQTVDENSFIEKVKTDLLSMGIHFVDIRPTLENIKNDKQLYYKTDHHWTSFAAYDSYLQLANELNLNGKNIIYTPTLVSDTFRGTLSASSGFQTQETDPVYVFLPNPPLDYTVTYVSEGITTATCFETEPLEKRDHYSLFFNGNHPQVKIDSNKVGKKLLVIKDSYANCFVPFLINDYQKIFMVDPRYYKDDLNSLIKSEGITDVLYLYNISTFSEG